MTLHPTPQERLLVPFYFNPDMGLAGRRFTPISFLQKIWTTKQIVFRVRGVTLGDKLHRWLSQSLISSLSSAMAKIILTSRNARKDSFCQRFFWKDYCEDYCLEKNALHFGSNNWLRVQYLEVTLFYADVSKHLIVPWTSSYPSNFLVQSC